MANQQHEVITRYLADLPDLVTPEILAAKLGISIKALWQRQWRSRNIPNYKDSLPPRFPIPGSNSVFFERSQVIDWWLTQNENKTESPTDIKRRGRPTIASKIGGLA